ncbi:hypothetical protein AAG906_020610 [Vitis piasezkii]
MESPIDARRVKEILEHDRVYQFLLGSCIREKPFLDLHEAFMLIKGEKSYRELKGKNVRILT